VDDRPTNRDILVRLLSNSGFQVAEAHGGQEAINLQKKNEYPLILMDIRMPGKNGIETTQEMSALGLLNNSVVIAISASVSPEAKSRFLREGFQDFIGKPFRASEVFSAIERHLKPKFPDAFATDSQSLALADSSLTFGHEAYLESTQSGFHSIAGVSSNGNGGPEGVEKEFLFPWRDRINNAADLGDVGALRKIADEIEHSKSVECSSKLAELIRRRAKNFDFEGLANLCECPKDQRPENSITTTPKT
jgi:CheY-like chemotaxis protein